MVRILCKRSMPYAAGSECQLGSENSAPFSGNPVCRGGYGGHLHGIVQRVSRRLEPAVFQLMATVSKSRPILEMRRRVRSSRLTRLTSAEGINPQSRQPNDCLLSRRRPLQLRRENDRGRHQEAVHRVSAWFCEGYVLTKSIPKYG